MITREMLLKWLDERDKLMALVNDLANWQDWDGVNHEKPSNGKPTLYSLRDHAKVLVEGK